MILLGEYKMTKRKALLYLRSQPGFRIVSPSDYMRLTKYIGTTGIPIEHTEIEVKDMKISGIRHGSNVYIPCDDLEICNCYYDVDYLNKKKIGSDGIPKLYS